MSHGPCAGVFGAHVTVHGARSLAQCCPKQLWPQGCGHVLHTGTPSGCGQFSSQVPQCELPPGRQGHGVTRPCHWPGWGGSSGRCPPIHTWDGVRRRGLRERTRFRPGHEGGARQDQHLYEELRGPGLPLPPRYGDTVRRWHL